MNHWNLASSMHSTQRKATSRLLPPCLSSTSGSKAAAVQLEATEQGSRTAKLPLRETSETGEGESEVEGSGKSRKAEGAGASSLQLRLLVGMIWSLRAPHSLLIALSQELSPSLPLR